jgi:hypothetical protein
MKKFITIVSIAAIAVFTGFAAKADVIGTTLTLGGTPVLGQGLNISGSCGTTSSGSPVVVNLVRPGSNVNLGSTTTTGSEGAFNATFNVPANAGGGPVAIVAQCPTGTITLNTSIIDPSASAALTDTSPSIGGAFTVTGVCGTTAGGSVSFTLSNASQQTILGTTQTSANGSFATTLIVPGNFAQGAGLLVATCPTGNVMISSVRIDPATSGGTVDLGGGQAAAAGTTTPVTTGAVSTTPTGGVAAGKTQPISLMFGLLLLGLGIIGLAMKRSSLYTNDV